MEEIKKLALDIQFFADEDDDLDNDELDNEEFDDDNVDDEELEEDSSEEEDEKSESSDEDESKEEDKEEKKEKQKQSREENAKYKALRQESKRIQEEQERAREQGKIEGIKLAYGGKNKFTGEDLTDDFSVKTFMTMLDMEKEGLDPVEDYAKYVTDQERKKAEETQKKEKDKAWFANDRQAFVDAYPDVSLDELIEDEDFKLFTKGRVGLTPLKEMYADFRLLIDKYEKKAKQEARKRAAKGMSSAGGVKNEQVESEYYTMEEISKYSSKELNRLKVSDPKKYQKIMDSYDHNIKQ